MEANHQYAHVRFPSGRETTVSTNQLAPSEQATRNKPLNEPPQNIKELHQPTNHEALDIKCPQSLEALNDEPLTERETLRRSRRNIQPPDRYGFNAGD